MIRDAERFAQWERAYLRSEPVDFFKNLRLVDALYAEARALGIFPLKNPLDGLEVKIRLAKVLNVSTPH